MPRRKRSLIAPPAEWVESLIEHHHDLARVQMLWRRGAVPYRQVIPFDANPETPRDWDELELDDTHFEWDLGDVKFPAERREKIEDIVQGLWDIAIDMARARGGWCDFQLAGYDRDEEQLFESGRRCKLPGADAPDEPAGNKSGSSAPQRDQIRWLKYTMEQAQADRDHAFERSRQTLTENHDLWTQASDAVKAAIDYQREQIEHFRDERTGRIELKARAFAEMERTQRLANAFEVLKYTWDSAMTHFPPLANRLFDILGNVNMTVFPEFKSAQQAIAYLLLTLNNTQLKLLWDGDMKAAGAMAALLDDAAQMENERDALVRVAPLVRLFRSELFRDVARPEQQLAAGYIINKLALYRLNDYGPEQPEPSV